MIKTFFVTLVLIFITCSQFALTQDIEAANEFTVINFTVYAADEYIDANQFIDRGLSSIRGYPEDDYCADAQAAILSPGTARFDKSFLSTASDSRFIRCKTIPLRIELTQEVKFVEIEFYGARVDYELIGFRSDNSIAAIQTQSAYPYDYSKPFYVTIESEESDISHFTFGYTKALTIITRIRYK